MGMKVRLDWQLKQGVAGWWNFSLILVLLFAFPLVLRVSRALPADRPNEHPHAGLLRFSIIVGSFLWACFAVAWIGIRRQGAVSPTELIGMSWHRWQSVVRDLGIAALTLAAMTVIGNVSNVWLARIDTQASAYRAVTALLDKTEAAAFLIVALTAGFVEEFVFRGYLQKQFQAFCGNVPLASILQVLVFTQGHLYQGWIRLIPVALIGALLTGVALWRRSLVPGIIAHGVGDSLVALSFFVRHA